MTDNFTKYLDYYETLNNPGYAVLISGHWGAGKTYQIQNYYGKDRSYYVSLFGVRSPEEAHSAVYAAYAPNFDAVTSRLGKMSADLATAGGLFSIAGAATGWLSAAIRKQLTPDRTLIFDDLERSSMPLEEMMGVFSTYIDSLNFRVVLIADEEKLTKKFKTFPKVKEKLIGHTMAVRPNILAAFPSFCSSVAEKHRGFIENWKDLIVSIFSSSNCMSLRILRHVILDLSRLHQCLSAKQIAHTAAMTELISLFVAFDIEFRMGNLNSEDFRNRAGSQTRYLMRQEASKANPAPKPRFIEFAEKHPTVDVENQILEDEVLYEIFVNGDFNPERIVSSVNGSSYFKQKDALPFWKQLAQFDDAEDSEVQAALTNVQRQFDSREVVSSGDMLHIFALRLLMAAQGISGSTIQQAYDECIQYIMDLVASERLPPRELDWGWRDRFDHAHGGYLYWVQESYSAEFKNLLDKLIVERQACLERQYPTFVAELIQTMKKDGKAFYRSVCLTANNDSPLALVPIFKASDPVQFVDDWLAAPRTEWRMISRALEDRLEVHRVSHELKEERVWALAVLSEIEKRREALQGFEKLRVSRIVPSKLNALRSM